MDSVLTLDGRLSADGERLIISSEIHFLLSSKYYQQRRYGELGLIPKEISFSEKGAGIAERITETLVEESFGTMSLKFSEGARDIEFYFVGEALRGSYRYIVRRGQYKKDDLFALYLQEEGKVNLSRIGMGIVDFEEEYVPKLLGFGITDGLQRNGHGTSFLAAIEHICAPENMFLLLHDPLNSAIPFYVKNGYRFLEHPNGLDLAKVLNPKFDERLLMPRV